MIKGSQHWQDLGSLLNCMKMGSFCEVKAKRRIGKKRHVDIYIICVVKGRYLTAGIQKKSLGIKSWTVLSWTTV